jgi:hypothetical protein
MHFGDQIDKDKTNIMERKPKLLTISLLADTAVSYLCDDDSPVKEQSKISG